jgi:hypothetical protein
MTGSKRESKTAHPSRESLLLVCDAAKQATLEKVGYHVENTRTHELESPNRK